jgi:hypothetical protein
MEWATGIRMSNRLWVATLMSKEGVREVTLDALVSSGLPSVRTERIVLEQEMGAWRETASNDYLVAFGMNEETLTSNCHAVYETQHGELRVLIPALVIMRTFFRPTQYLLPQMLLAQALDRVRFMDRSVSPPRVTFLRSTLRNLGARYGDLVTPISWMSVFPSAIAFAASPHLHARSGRIAVTLPAAMV